MSTSSILLPTFTLLSHPLCPYVQRAAILLREKGIPFERKEIDLANKPTWFLQLSPLGKTPVLMVDDEAIFESAVICEYLDETQAPHLHPAHPLQRARHRAWMEFGTSILNSVASFYNAPDEKTLALKVNEIAEKFAQIELVLSERGGYFSGEDFSMVDAVFGPLFRYFDTFELIDDFGFFKHTPKVCAWRQQLALRPSIQGAVSGDFREQLTTFLVNRQSALSKRMEKIFAPREMITA
ncbi:glutathione S-transferase family protein [Undibacterium flavidum]|uniref:glutathione transferase n=1 Tax=Undibacterium flavidum TaxID=2762297 RepID=A0ABR6YG48_9BURK|nr:glutathione S-transferase family protein [Undibacterium flavidum]MBC3875559.1 glutathione S-transferase family protein [Undibacterium flavidum]